MSVNFHIASAALLASLLFVPSLARIFLGLPYRPTRKRPDQEVLDRATQILAGSMVVDAPLLRNLRDHLATTLPLLHLSLWDEAHQVSTGPSESLGPPSFVIPLPDGRGEIQVWLAQHRTHRRTERILHWMLPWLQAALRSSKAFQLTHFEAITDPLTGLGNRRLLYAERRKHAETGGAFGVLLIDLNDFKSINDTWDHRVGDQALMRFTQIMQACTRHSDTLVRLGGDEFMIVARDVDAEGMQLLAERLIERSACSPISLPNGSKYRLSAAYGWACFPADGDDWEVLIALADQRMYDNKAEQKAAVA